MVTGATRVGREYGKMKHCSILVVEDEIFVATDIESMVAELGHQPVGIAADANSAIDLAPRADIALVCLLYTSPSPRDS